MNISVKEVDYCKFEFDVATNKEMVDKKKQEVLSHFKNATCPGYRKGKAPKEAILTHYKSQVEESLKRALAEEVFHDAVFEKDLKNLGSPVFKSMFVKDGKFYCSFVVDTVPKFELKDVKSLQVPRPVNQESVSDVANQKMEELRQRFGETVFYSTSDFVENGDSVILSYKAFDGEELIPQLCAESEVVTVGTKTDKDFSDNLLGMQLNEEREFDYTIKPNAQSSLANKQVKFKVKLTNGTKTKPHALNNELAAKMNKENLLELQEHVNKIASGIVDSRFKQMLQTSVSSVLTEMHDFKVQDWLVEKEAMLICKAAKLDFQSLNDEDKKMWLKLGEKNVKLSLVLEKVRESEPEAQLTDQEVLEHLKRLLANELVDNSNEALLSYLGKMGNYAHVLFARVKDEFALNYVVSKCKFVE